MSDDTKECLRVKCFRGSLHGQLAPFAGKPIFRCVDTRWNAMPARYSGDSIHTESTQPRFELGEYTTQSFSRHYWKSIVDPKWNNPLTAWQRFLVWAGFRRELTESEKPKLHFIGKQRGYLYAWNWDGKPFLVTAKSEDLIAWDSIVWTRAAPHEVPHGFEATESGVSDER